MGRVRRWGEVVKDAARIAYATQLTFGAASITYYLLVSLVPLSLLLFIALNNVVGGNLATYVLVQAEEFLTPQGYSVIQDVLTQTAGRGSATVIGVFFLLWTLYEMFHSFDIAVAQIQGKPYDSSITELLWDIAIVLIMINGAIIFLTAAETVITALAPAVFHSVVARIMQFILLTAIFISLYYRFSVRRYQLSDLLPGAVFAATGWSLLQVVFNSYVSMKMQFIGTPIYELFGGLLLFIIWLYTASSVLLFGIAINTAHTHPHIKALLDPHRQTRP